MPTLTVRAYAELIHLPGYEWHRILTEHKYPNQGPAPFKIPYYKPALRCIERFYLRGNDFSVLPTSPSQLSGVGNAVGRRQHNYRVIEGFRNSEQAHREFTPVPVSTFGAELGPVTLRATPDLAGTEDSSPRFLIYNCKAIDPEEELIRTTVELFYWVLMRNDVEVALRSVEYVLPCSNDVYRWNGNVRVRTIHRAESIANAIEQVWDGI